MNKFRLSENQKETLKIIGQCLILASAIAVPNIIKLLKPKNRFQKYYNKNIINRLAEKDVVYLFGDKIKLTPRGLELLRKIQIEDIAIRKPDEWNNIWHLVSYDIPENKKKERDFFRRKLTNLDFRQIQKSLWVIPYECEEEIAVIAQNLGISPYVAYLNTGYLPQQEKLLKNFNIKQFL